MDDVKDHGGPVFPQRFENHGTEPVDFFVEILPGKFQQFGGMTMRDYFAAEAMHAFISRWAGHDSYDESGGGFQRVAGHAYEMADAMLEARK